MKKPIFEIFGAILLALIIEATTGLFSWDWGQIRDFTWTPKLEVTLNKCIIYRTAATEFPFCEMDLVVNNTSSRTFLSA